jgi:serpin B
MRLRIGFLLCLGAVISGGPPAIAGPPEKVTKVSSDVSALSRANNEFAVSLFRKLPGERQNRFFSPTSLAAALTMSYAGARGETADQMAKVLHIGALGPKVHSVFASFLNDIDHQARQKGDRLEFASALWGRLEESSLVDFRTILQRDYQSDLYEVDFRNPEAACRTINDWSARQTQGRISEVLSPGSLDPDTRLILINAIYFKGAWSSPFSDAYTWSERFQTLDGPGNSIPFMHRSDVFPYWENEEFQLLELPYADGAIVMDLLLPRKNDGLKALESRISVDSIASWLSRPCKKRVDVALPKFKFTTTVELKSVLSELGMPSAFSSGADFSGMAPDGKGFSLAGLVHKAFIEVNEEGTEAAAASTLKFEIMSASSNWPIFRADHPFLFLIRDLRSGSILFMGRVVNPADTAEVLETRN